MGYYFRLATRVILFTPSHRQDNTYYGLCYTSCGALAGTRHISMGKGRRESEIEKTERQGQRWRRNDNVAFLTQYAELYYRYIHWRFEHAHHKTTYLLNRAGRSSEVECSLMVRWVVGSILHGRAISRSSQCSTTGVTKAMVCAILSVGWLYKRTLAVNRKE